MRLSKNYENWLRVDKVIAIIKQHPCMLWQGGPRDAAVNFDRYQILQRHRAVSLPQDAFLVGLCLQTAVNYLSKSDK